MKQPVPDTMNSTIMQSEFGPDTAEMTKNGSIGDIIRQTNNLSAEQVERILAHQRHSGMKFGEAAIALGFAKEEDVLWALAQQFHYPYSNQTSQRLGSELVVATRPFCDQAEMFRAMRSQLLSHVFKADGHPKPALAVVSPEAGDGKSYFAANIAVAFSQLGGRSLLIDADMRSPRLHEVFGVANTSGLSGILAGRAETKVIHAVKDLPSLHVLPVGVVPPNPLELLERPTFGLMIRQLTQKFDHVIVDTPSASAGSDARVIAAHCGAALGVCRKGRTSMDSMHALFAPMKLGAVRMAGVVINEY